MPDIHLEGTCGAPLWPDEPHFTPAQVRADLAAAQGGDVTVRLNSGGGIATDGLAIYHALRDYPGRVTVEVTGIAASAASLIAMAGDVIRLRQGAMLMIHDPARPWTDGRGTEDDHRALADSLAKMSAGYADIYAARAGITSDQAREIMRAETWLTPAEALALGFADEIETAEAEPPAVFAYAAYAHAPAPLLAGPMARGAARLAVLAMITGQPPATLKGKPMPKPVTAQTAPDEIEAQDDETALPEDETTAAVTVEIDEDDSEDDDVAAPGAAPESDPEDDAAETDAAEGEDDDEPANADAVAILDLVTMHGGTPADARDFLARRLPLAAVVAHYRQKGQTVPTTPTGSGARITRDERETRRIGMTEALHAQFSRRDPSDDRARPFMAMTLAEMAAMSSGHRGALRTADDRQRVFMDMHSTSDFPLALSNALQKALLDRYTQSPSVYRQIAREQSFRDFRPHSMIRAGDFPTLLEVPETGEVKSGTIGESAETVTLKSYGRKVSISRQTLINDDVRAIADAIADQGRAVQRFEDATFFSLCFGNADGPVLSNSRRVFNATDSTKASSAGAISVTTLAAGRAAIRGHTSGDGAKLNLAPRILLVSPENETLAEQVTSPLVPAASGDVNPFSGRLTVVATPHLTGNAWYLLADPMDATIFVYGFLEGASGPRMRMEEIFGTQGMTYLLEHDFAAGAAGRAGGWANAGA